MRFFPNNAIRKIILVSLGICMIGITSGLLLYIYKNAVAQAFHNATAGRKEAFTELYFQSNEHLPSKPAVITDFTAVTYTFSFNIHNLEGKDMTYTYAVTTVGEKNQTIDQRSILIKNNQTKTISESFILPNAITTRTKVTVTLLNKKQSIFFWMGGVE